VTVGVGVGMFLDRADAGRRLARCVGHLRRENTVVVGLPRGGVQVALEVARELHAPLDVIVVRKLGVPLQQELAMGAIGEDGARVIDEDVIAAARVTGEQVAEVEVREQAELRRRMRRFRAGQDRISLAGRVVLIVDDGVATGSSAKAACLVARAQGATRVVLAVPVAPVGWQERLADVADELICVSTPAPFLDIGRFYADFSETTDEQVLACLGQAPTAAQGDPVLPLRDEEVEIPITGATLHGQLTVPAGTSGVVVFAHGSGSSRHSPRNRLVARRLNRAGLATLLFDLLTAVEGGYRTNVFDIDLLAGRLTTATAWLRDGPGFAGVPLGWFGASTGAAAALWAAAEPGADVAAVVSRGGRPDLAADRLSLVRAPTLLIVGELDPVVLNLNQQALNRLRCPARLAVVPGATHLFEEPGTLETAADAARAWFLSHLASTVGPGHDRERHRR
jgi:putative phosphoribosyl transferase